MSRGEFLIRGLVIEPGSAKERLAHYAIERERQVQFLSILTIFNAIIHVGNTIAAAVSGSPASGQNNAGKVLDVLKKLLLPGEAERTEVKAEEVKAKLEREMAKGPMQVRTVDDGSRHNRARRRRR